MLYFRLLVLAFLFTAPCLAQEALQATPEKAVDEIFARWDTTVSPGCAVSVMKDGQIVYKRGYGMADLDHDVPIRTDSVFHVASVSKQFTAAAVVLLALEGRLSLDDSVQKHLPEVPDFGPKITLRHLIHHTSGLRDQWSLLGMSGWRYSLDLITDEDVMYLVTRQKDLNFPPGHRYLYSNTGYTLLGQVVKKVSGKSLREFTTERIFNPLGMTNTHFRDDHAEIVKNQAIGYSWSAQKSAYRLSVTNFDTVGATSLLTTVEDMARWDANFINQKVGGKRFIEQILKRGRLNNGRDQTYAFGLVHGVYKGLKTVGHGGSDAGYRADFLRFPEQGLSLACLCNLAQTNPGNLLREVADVYLAEQLKEPATGTDKVAEIKEVPMSEAERTRAVGAYWSDERGQAVQIKADGDSLRFHVSASRSFPIRHVGDGRFRIDEIRLRVRLEPPSEGSVQHLVVRSADEEDEETLKRIEPFEVNAGGLAEFAGDYVSDEIELVYRIVAGEKTITLHRFKSRPSELSPMGKDLFYGSTGSLRFQRDASGKVSGFILDRGRIRNFRFQKRGE